MHAELAKIDPNTASRLSPNDSQRIQRALEIWMITGQPMSELIGATHQTDLPVATFTISLEPSTRSVLHTRIERRFDQMLGEGLVDEVRALHARTDLHSGLPSVRCVGYRQVWDMLDGKIDLSTAREQAIAATRQLAKRQLTWLRSLPDRFVVDALSPVATDAVLALVSRLKG